MSSLPSCMLFCGSQFDDGFAIQQFDCDGLGSIFASNCQCAESPLNQVLSCLSSLCSSAQLNKLLEEESIRCGATPSESPTGIVATTFESNINPISHSATATQPSVSGTLTDSTSAQPPIIVPTVDSVVLGTDSFATTSHHSSMTTSAGETSTAAPDATTASSVTTGSSLPGSNQHIFRTSTTHTSNSTSLSATASLKLTAMPFANTSGSSSPSIDTPTSSIVVGGPAGSAVAGDALNSATGSSRHMSSKILIAVVLPITLVVLSVLGILARFKLRKVRSRTKEVFPSAPDYTPDMHALPTTASSESLADVSNELERLAPEVSSLAPSSTAISSCQPRENASTQAEYSAYAHEGSTTSTCISPHFTPAEKMGHAEADRSAFPTALPPRAPDDGYAQPGDLTEGSDSSLSNSLPRYGQLTDTPEPTALLQPVADDPSQGIPPPSGEPSIRTQHETRLVIESEAHWHARAQGANVDGADGREHVVVLPWPLGERLLSFLASTSTPGAREAGGEGSTSVGSKTLPAYAPRPGE